MPSYAIVGASRGLGYEWLRQLSTDSNNTIIGVARTPGNVESQLKKDNITNVSIVAGDLVNSQSLEDAAIATADITGGALDYLIINGAYLSEDNWHLEPTEFKGKEEYLKTDFFRSVETNVVGTMYAVNAFLPLIRKGTVKKIVAISSGHADMDLILDGGVSVSLIYSAAKAAMNVVIAKYGMELKPEGIKFLTLSPGYVATSQAAPAGAQLEKAKIMGAQFSALYPQWKGPTQPNESVEAQRKVIGDLTIEKSGQFLSHFGTKQWL